jgi:hypothetical protein
LQSKQTILQSEELTYTAPVYEADPVTIEITPEVRTGKWEQAQRISLPSDMVLVESNMDTSYASSAKYPILLDILGRVQWYFPGTHAIPIVDGSKLPAGFDTEQWYDKVLIADSIPFKCHRNAHIILDSRGVTVTTDKNAALETAARNIAAGKNTQFNIPVSGYSWENHVRKYGVKDTLASTATAFWKSIEKFVGKENEPVTAVWCEQKDEPVIIKKVHKGSAWKYLTYTWRTVECLIVFSCWAVIGKIIVSHLK